MKKRYGILLGLALLSIGSAAAQEPIRREVDVTRAYEPSVQEALKLNRMPDMTDTAQMRPELRYEITPRPLEYNFGVEALVPARFAAVDEPGQLPFHVKLGAGSPLQSVADLRYSQSSRRANYGAFASHYGRYDQVENGMQIEESAFGTDNRAGAFFHFRPDDGFSIDVDAGYRFRNVTRYGYYGPAADMTYYDLSDNALKQFFHNPHAKISMGSDLTNFPLMIRVGAGLDYFADRYKYDQNRWDLDWLIGFRAGTNGLVTVDGNTGLTRGYNNLKGYKNQISRAALSYGGETDGFRYRLGLGIGVWETTYREGLEPVEYWEPTDKTAFLPELLLEKELFRGGLTPFLELRSEMVDNSFGELIKRNPYVFSGVSAPNTTAYHSQLGARGTLGNTLKYKVYLGYDYLYNYLYWVNVQEYSSFGNAFTACVKPSLELLHAGAEVQANLLNVFTIHGAIRGTTVANPEHWHPGPAPRPGGLPELTIRGGASYNYRNRLYLNVEAEMTGERDVYQSYNGSSVVTQLPTQVDLRAGVEYFVNRRLGLFLQLNNLLNQELYEFNHYREMGANGMAGIKISF